MPALTIPTIPHYVQPPPTELDLEYADLTIIDLSLAGTAEGRAELAKKLHTAMTEEGFFYVVGHGYTQDQNDRIFDIADAPFSQVSAEEKKAYAGTMLQTGSYQGYKLRNYWHIDKGVHDQLEHYNSKPDRDLTETLDSNCTAVNRDITKREHPTAVRPLLPEIRAFAEFNHVQVLYQLLRLFALGLGLPEQTLVNIHGLNAVGETYVRFMKYYPRSADEEEKTKNVWLKGHTDFGSVTILWSQPVSGLQILTKNNEWKWVRHIPNALVINAGDAMAFLTGGIYPATIHRVIQPPADQQSYTRVGVFYFCMPDDNVVLKPLEGISGLSAHASESKTAPTMEEWRKGRTTAYGKSTLNAGDKPGVEEEVIAGVVVKHYS